MNCKIFWRDNNKIRLNTHKVTVRKYHSLEKNEYTDSVCYVNKDGLNEIEVNFVPKHQLYDIVAKEELNVKDYIWMDGIELRTDTPGIEIAEIAACGSIEAYQASLPESTDDFKIDTDYRLSKLELGI